MLRIRIVPALVSLFLWGGVVPKSMADDWPQFLGPSRNGVAKETGLVDHWDEKGPPRVWTKKIGAGFSGSVVAGGRVILFHRVGDDEVVESLDAATGQSQWQHAYPSRYRDDFGFDDGPRSTPLVADGRVYTLGAAGMLFCLELSTGKKLWQRSLNEEYQVRKGFFGVATSPFIVDNRLLINVGGRGAGIVAFAAGDGKELWKATSDEASYSSPAAAVVAEKLHVFFLTRDGLVAVEPRQGTVLYRKHWRSRMNASVNAATPIVLENNVFISACYDTGALLLRFRSDGVDEVWKSDEVMSNHYDTCVPWRDLLFGCDGRQEQGVRLRCVEWKTGKVRWTKEGFGCASIILADEKLIILNESGDLILAEPNAEAYREKARAAVLSKPVRAQPALADGRLLARDTKQLICFDLRRKR